MVNLVDLLDMDDPPTPPPPKPRKPTKSSAATPQVPQVRKAITPPKLVKVAKPAWLPEDEEADDCKAEIPFCLESDDIVSIKVTETGVMLRPKCYQSPDGFFNSPCGRFILDIKDSVWPALFHNFKRNSHAPWCSEGFFYRAVLDTLSRKFIGTLAPLLSKKRYSYPRSRLVAFARIKSIAEYLANQADVSVCVEALADLYLALAVMLQ